MNKKNNYCNEILLKFYYQISYKPNFILLKKKEYKTNKLFFKNFLYFFLILNFLKDFYKDLNYSFVFFKKKKNFKSYIKAPNRYKNSQRKLHFIYYIGVLKIYFYNKINFNIFFFFFILKNINYLFNLFETTLLALQKNYIMIKNKYYKIL